MRNYLRNISRVFAKHKSKNNFQPNISQNIALLSRYFYKSPARCMQCLSQDLETGCLKLAVVKFLGVQIFKGDHNILIFQP